MANRILSIEIGSQITNVIETDFKVKNPKIYKSFSFKTPEELFRGEEVGDSGVFKERLFEGLKENKIKTKRVLFILNSSRIASRDVIIPKVKENQILTLLYANSAEYFPVDLQQYQLVYRIIGEVEEEGEKKHKLMVLAVPHDMIDTYQKLTSECGLILETLDYVGNAATQILMERIPEKLYAAVKVEDDTTLVTIVRDGRIHLQRSFSYGIEEAVGAIQRRERFGENLDFEKALEILRTESFCNKEDADEYIRDMADDLGESFRAIIGNVSRVINFYSSNHAGAEMENVILYGMGADVWDLENALRNELNVPVTSQPLREVVVQEKSDLNQNFYPLSFATCAGAAIEPMDFRLEEEERKKKKEKKKEERTRGKKINISLTAPGFLKLCILVSVVLLLAVIPYHIFLKIDMKKMQKEQADKQYLADLYATSEKSRKEYEDISSLYESTGTTSEGIGAFLLELEEKMPSNIYVRSLTSDSAAVVMDFSVKTKREAVKVIDEMTAFECISNVEVLSLEETRDEMNNATVNCMITCSYVGGTTEEEEMQDTTMEEDVNALQSSSNEIKTE